MKEDELDLEILKAAKTLFSQYGLKKTTMDEVAKVVGKGKSTLYYYYPGKTELFQSVVKHEMMNATKLIRVAVNRESTAFAKFSAYILSRLALRAESVNLSKVVLDDIFDHYKEIYPLKEEFEEIHLNFIKEIINGGVQCDEFKKMSENDICFLSSWINAALSGLERPGQKSISVNNTTDCNQIISYILYGIVKS
ncbi:TetR/AcrR family transcriptional regulator [Pedobacter arcticus]|uniref:TetR/AcrR family transcriptional regulator n=1 Tax=Pedobacter arcticus TaxID=752140 RepID=UPI0002D5482F|nr:TetR/AcrR family transcriptional regulator [Pedobacter arcticus]